MASAPAPGSSEDGRTPAEVSREHVDTFLHRRRLGEEDLGRTVGRAAVGKLHPWIIGQILADRQEAEFAAYLGAATPIQESTHDVLVNMVSGRVKRSAASPSDPQETRDRIRTRRSEAALSLGRLKEDLGQRGIEIRDEFWLTDSVLVTLTTSQVEAIAARGDVDSMTSDKRQLVLALDTSRPLIGADQVQAAGVTGRGVTVAIQDTGVDASHPALVGIVAAQQDMTGTAVQRDDVGHGSHCAGIVASQDRTFRGIAPGANLLDIRLMDTTGAAQPSWCVAAFTAAVTSGANVSSNSWGFSHANGAWVDADGTCVLCTAANNAVAAGVAVVVAGGNEDNDSCSSYDTHLRCPGLAQSVITVAASDDADHMADFSSVGPTPDARPKPDVTAPGVDIASCQATGTALGTVVAPGFINLSGTSMATPHVAGVAALILNRNAGQSPANVKSLIMSTAVNIGATPNEMGAGRVDALAAVNSTPSP
jgi:serine protease AprX